MSLNRELDRRVSRIDKLLQRVLILFLLGEISSFTAKLRAKEIIESEYESFMAWFMREYGTPKDFNKQATRIKAVIFNHLRDFENVVEHRTEEIEEKRKLRLRLHLLAIGFVFSLQHSAITELALTLKVLVIWKATLDEKTCEICRELDGTIYDPAKETIPLRPHPSCRCWLELLVV